MRVNAETTGCWVSASKRHLIVAPHFNAGRVFVGAVLTHREYDKGAWK